MKIPMHKEDLPTFEELSKEPGYSDIKYRIEIKESDPNYVWIHFDIDEYQYTYILLLMYHAGKRVIINKHIIK